MLKEVSCNSVNVKISITGGSYMAPKDKKSSIDLSNYLEDKEHRACFNYMEDNNALVAAV